MWFFRREELPLYDPVIVIHTGWIYKVTDAIMKLLEEGNLKKDT